MSTTGSSHLDNELHTVSVVIPTLGRDSLESAVESAAIQSWRPTEVIVVVNGTDRISDKRLRKLETILATVPLRVQSLPPYSGPSISRNLGAWMATSSHVAFLDDDDRLSPGYLEAIMGVFADRAPDIVYGATVRLDEEGGVQSEGRLNRVPRNQWFDRLYRQQNHGFGGTNLVVRRASFLRLGGFPVHLMSGEDRALAMAAISTGLEIEYVDHAVVICRNAQGVRASGRSDKWLVNLSLIVQYWTQVSWQSRLRSLYRVGRDLIREASKG